MEAFPDVCVISVSYNDSIAISHRTPTAGERETGMVSYRWIHTQCIKLPGALDPTPVNIQCVAIVVLLVCLDGPNHFFAVSLNIKTPH